MIAATGDRRFREEPGRHKGRSEGGRVGHCSVDGVMKSTVSSPLNQLFLGDFRPQITTQSVDGNFWRPFVDEIDR